METPEEARERITAEAVERYDQFPPVLKQLSDYVLNESKLDAEYINGYIVTDRDMTDRLDAAYVQNLIDKYGEGITSTVSDDMDDFGPLPDYSEFDPEFYGHDPE